MWATLRRLLLTALAGLFGYGFGWLVGAVGHYLPIMSDYPFLAEHLPYPHHVPEYPGGVSLRLAMVHDVVHERFPRHGADHYRERNRLTRAVLAKLDAADPARFPLDDDLAVGLERLGKSDEAVTVMRDKLARQEAKGVAGRELYTTYANLGTFLIHASMRQAITGDAAAKARCREGVAFVRKAVEVNPEAHFGRERWQVALAEFLLAALDDPKLLMTYDCLGNRLDLRIEDALNREGNWVDTGYGRLNDAALSQGKVDAEIPAFFRPGARLEDPALWKEVSPIRQHITKIGAEAGWEQVAMRSHHKPVPFDEPVLGIIGMWRQGGGANPHFALALGETMLRVGQRYLAWDAFERASRVADRVSPEPTVRQFLRDHCKRRQTEIEATFLFRPDEPDRRHPPWQAVSPPPTQAVVSALRAGFDAELAKGERFQHAYQQYESDKIAASVSITDDGFFDGFDDSIASPIGSEDWFVRVPRARIEQYEDRRRLAYGLLGAGVCSLTIALLFRWRAEQKRKQLKSSEPTAFERGWISYLPEP